MKKIIAILVASMMLLTSCSTATLDGAGKEVEDTITNVTDADNQYVRMVKGGYRVDDPDLTYEDAFTAFFGTPRWKYFESEDGQDVVEFTGDCTYQDVPVKARIQFVVDEENGTFEATYLALNEVPQDALTLAAVISKAFEEAETSKSATENSGSVNPDSSSFIYNGKSLSDLLGEDSGKVSDVFGQPTGGTPVTGELLYGGTEYWLYDDVGFYFDNSAVAWISADPEMVTLNGTPLNLTPSELYDKFGESSYERYIQDESGESEDYYYMEYIIDGIVVGFEMPDAESRANYVTLSKYIGDDDAPVDDDTGIDDDYSWVEGDIDDDNIGNFGSLDPLLVGRWRSYSGKAITLDDTGNIETSWKVWDRISDTPESVTWTAENGCLEIRAVFVDDTSYSIKTEFGLEQLALGHPGEDDQQVMYYRTDTGTNALAGEWTSNDNLRGDMTLYEDGTGYRSGIHFSWYADDTIFTVVDTQGRAYDYTVSGDMLTLFFSEGAEIFTRVGN